MKKINKIILFLFILLLPTQLGKHFFFDFSYISGVRVDYLAPTVYITDILALVLFILNVKTLKYFFCQKKILIICLLLFINIFFSQSPFISLYRYIKIIEFLAIFAVFRQKKISSKLLLLGFLTGGVFELFLIVFQFAQKQSLQSIFYFFGERTVDLSSPGIAKATLNGIEFLRPYGTFSHPNSLAGFYLLLYFYILTVKRLFSIVPKNLLLFICMCLIFISFSKLAIVIFLLLNLIYLWKNKEALNCRICRLSRFVILLIISLLFLKAQTDPLTLQKRYLLLNNSLSIISGNLLFGVGLGSYIIAQSLFQTRYLDLLNQPVHNIFLLFISEAGLVITVIFSVIFAKYALNLIKLSPFVFAVFIISGSFDHYWLTLQQNLLLSGVLFGILANEG